MIPALAALAAALAGFLAGSYYEYARAGGSLDLSGRLGDARRELARQRGLQQAAAFAETWTGPPEEAWMERVRRDMREQS